MTIIQDNLKVIYNGGDKIKVNSNAYLVPSHLIGKTLKVKNGNIFLGDFKLNEKTGIFISSSNNIQIWKPFNFYILFCIISILLVILFYLK